MDGKAEVGYADEQSHAGEKNHHLCKGQMRTAAFPRGLDVSSGLRRAGSRGEQPVRFLCIAQPSAFPHYACTFTQ
jgi:hypothetical protein